MSRFIVRSRAPLRLGLSGGGTDVAPFCEKYGGYVLNATINKYIYTTIEILEENVVEFVSTDQSRVYRTPLTSYIEPKDELILHKAVYNRIVKQYNNGNAIPVRVTTFSEAPSGSGLGSSSTLVVCMVAAFSELLNLPLGEYDLAHLSYEIERIDIGMNGGKQDQYAAAFGGFNFMEFGKNDHVIVNPLRIKDWVISELEASIVLFYLGISRDSEKIIKEQSDNVKKGDTKSVEAMHKLKEEALQAKESLLRGNLEVFSKSMCSGWKYKIETAKAVTNNCIDTIYNVALSNGAKSGKISGAGGGGFMILLVDPINRKKLISALQEQQGAIFDCKFTFTGAQAWRIPI